jgi:DNA-directed RNA polymerase omega subunit
MRERPEGELWILKCSTQRPALEKRLMPYKDEPENNGLGDDADWPGIDSRFRLVLVAAQRSKQLQRGARPRVTADPKRRRSTSIALEEVKRGLVPFINNTKDTPREDGEGEATVQDAKVH